MSKGTGRKQTFAITVLGVLPFLCVIACLSATEVPTVIPLSFLGLAAVSVVLMLFVINGEVPIFQLRMKESELNLSPLPKELGPPKRKRLNIVSSIDRQSADKQHSKEDKIFQKLYDIIEKEEASPKKYAEALEFLNRYPGLAKKSWLYHTHYARTLILLGQYERAREIAEAVLAKFPNRKAATVAYEILTLVLEARATVADDKLSAELLEQRMRYVQKGLQADPQRIYHLLNGFEIAVQQNKPMDAMVYLLATVDLDFETAIDHLSRSTELDRAKALSPELADALNVIGLDNQTYGNENWRTH